MCGNCVIALEHIDRAIEHLVMREGADIIEALWQANNS
jgi:hypothetical protein